MAGKRVDLDVSLYCDESGNSGPNLLDTTQPVYVLGGWVVPAKDAAAVEHVVRRVLAPPIAGPREIHGTRFLKTRRGQAAFEGFIAAMCASGAWPVFIIAEKRYWIAGKIVETFLDPFYNATSSWAFYNDVERKQELAHELSQLPDEYLHEFAAAYRTLDQEGLSKCARRLSSLYDLKGDAQLAKAFRTSVESLDKVAEAERSANSSLPSGALSTVNLPVLVSFLSLVEDMARDLALHSVRIFHDESREFGRAYQWAFSIYQNAQPPLELRFPNDRLVVFRFQKVTSFEMVESHKCPLVQAADVLVNGLYSFACYAARGERPPQWLAAPLGILVSAAILPGCFDVPTLVHFIASASFVSSIGQHIPTRTGR